MYFLATPGEAATLFTMTLETLSLSLHNGVAVVTLTRSQKANSVNRRMVDELIRTLTEISKDDAVRAVVLTGEGKAFCAGQDLAEATSSEAIGPLDVVVRERWNPIVRLIRDSTKPFVCAVNGVAAGAGANLALVCDIVFASNEASFSQAFIHVGLVPDSGGTWMLPRLVGMGRAAPMMMLGERISAVEAREMGLIYKVVDAGNLMAAAMEAAVKLASLPPLAIALTKRALNNSSTNTFNQQLELEAVFQGEVGKTSDHAEGVRAFLEKRRPVFTGK